LVPPPTYTFAAVAGRWGGKHSFGLTLVLGLLCSLLFLILLGRERTQRTQEFGPLNTRITRKVLALTRWRPLAYLAGPILILCDLCASVVHAVRWMLSVERWMLSVESVHPPSSILDPRSTSRFRLRLFPVWVKALTIWTIISLLGTESNWELLAANCPTGQTPIDDTVRVTEFTYDVDGRVTSVCSPEGTIHYEYDAATGRKTRMYTDNNDTRYTYDELGRLKTVAVHKKNGQPVSPAEVTTYNYTDVGSRESVEMANGTKTTYEYNDLKRLTKVSILDSQSSILSSFAYTLHATGRRTASTEITRQDDSSYTTNNFTWSYDQMYRLVSEVRGQGSEDQITDSYSYDLVGNRLSKNTESPVSGLLSSVSYSYNANDQLLQEVSTVTGTTTYSYDANGSQVQKSGGGVPAPTTYTYDLENRLAAAGINRIESGQTVSIVASYIYNPFGIRTRADTTTTIGAGQPTTRSKLFHVDSMNHTGYAQVLEEWSSTDSGDATLDRSYTIGDDVLSQSVGTSSPVTHHFGYDGHGSTRILTDDDGLIASGGRYNYDAYGVSLGETFGPSHLPLTSLLYTGEQFDTDLQHYYLRARYYNQTTGRFSSVDPFAGNNFDPQSLHKYAYAHGDPVNGSDPGGLLVISPTVFWTIVAIVAIIATAIVIYAHYKAKKDPEAYLNEHPYLASGPGRWRASASKTEGQAKIRNVKGAFITNNTTSQTYPEANLSDVFDKYTEVFYFACSRNCGYAVDTTATSLTFPDLATRKGITFVPALMRISGAPEPDNIIILVPDQFIKELEAPLPPSPPNQVPDLHWTRLGNQLWYETGTAEEKAAKQKIIMFYPGSSPLVPVYYLYDAIRGPDSPFGPYLSLDVYPAQKF
jgi:RHS repeat-associated protein